MMRRLTSIFVRYSAFLTIFCLLLGLMGGYFSVQLYKNLKPDIEELLPMETQSVQDYFELNRRLSSTDYLAVIVFPKAPAIGREFVGILAEKLSQVPKSVLARVEYKIDDVLKFFSKRRALYLEIEDLERIRDYVRDRINYEIELYNPFTILRNSSTQEPKLDLNQIEKKYSAQASHYTHFPGGYFATSNEGVFALLAFLPSGGSKIDNSHQLRIALDRVIAPLLEDQRFKGQLELKFTGGVQDLIEEHGSLMADLELSTVIVLVLVTLVISLYFRSFRATATLLVSLIVGAFWSFGISYGVVGYLNANSAFLGAIVLGNGINFGIIYLARYLEEVRRGRGHLRSILISAQGTAKATCVAAFAAALAYGSLALTEFRGFQQFGKIGLMAMVLCWISTYLMAPAVLTIFNAIQPVSRRTGHQTDSNSRDSYFGRLLGLFVSNYSYWIIAVTVLLSLGSITAISFHQGEVLETNLSNLRDRRSEESGSGFNSRYLHEIFQGYPHLTVVLTQSADEAELVARKLREKMKADGDQSLIASVQIVQDLLPQHQLQKIRILREIQRLLPPRVLINLSEHDREKVTSLITPEAFRSFGLIDLPGFIRQKMSEKDGTLGNLVLIDPPRQGVSENFVKLLEFVDTIRSISSSVRKGIPVAGQLAVSADMARAIKKDGPRATGASFLAVILLVIFLFRRPSSVIAVMSGLLLGALWLIGLIFALKIKINFLNFIALPITFGIGVDYAVNIYHRFVTEQGRDFTQALRHTGGAVALASCTTIIGYGSLLIAGNRAFVSFGALSTWGELTCLGAAILSLPAFMILMQKFRFSSSSKEKAFLPLA